MKQNNSKFVFEKQKQKHDFFFRKTEKQWFGYHEPRPLKYEKTAKALFESKISPLRIANQLKKIEIELLVRNIKSVLQKSINQGGTTLKDFKQANGKPGYFVQELSVYGRKDQPCMVCGNLLKEVRINNRTSVYCDKCQH